MTIRIDQLGERFFLVVGADRFELTVSQIADLYTKLRALKEAA